MQSYSDYCSRPTLYAKDKELICKWSTVLAQLCLPIHQGERPSQLLLEDALLLLSEIGSFCRPADPCCKNFRHTLALQLERQGHSNLLAHLVTLFAWLLRELPSVSPRCETFKVTAELWRRMQAAFLPWLTARVAKACPDSQALHATHSSFCRALINTQLLHCLSKLLHAHRSNLETAWRAGVPVQKEADMLEAAVQGWCEAVYLTYAIQGGLVLSCCC